MNPASARLAPRQAGNLRRRMARQQGGTLIVGLVMLLLLTLIGVSGTQVTSLEEKMAGNFLNRNLAFQAAESALRTAETWLHDQPAAPASSQFKCADAKGYYRGDCAWASNCLSTTNLWDTLECTSAWGDPKQTALFTGTLSQISSKPSYVIEELARGGALNADLEAGTAKPDTVMYRITARAAGGTPDAIAIVQSTFKK
jgi:type IV pilus assembly protein PilX